MQRIRITIVGLVLLLANEGCGPQQETSSRILVKTPTSATPGATPKSEEPPPVIEESTPPAPVAELACSEAPRVMAGGEAAPYALIAVGDGYIWTNSTDGQSSIRWWNRGSGDVQTLTSRSGQSGALAIRGSDVFFAEVSYASPNDSGEVFRISLKDGQVSSVSKSPKGHVIDEFSIAADDGTVYWLTHQHATLEQFVWALDQNTSEPRLVTSVKLPVDQTISGLHVDGDNLYWAMASGWAYRVKKRGGAPLLMVDDIDGIGGWDVRNGVMAYADLGSGRAVHYVIAPLHSEVLVAGAGARLGLKLLDDSIFYATDTSLHRVMLSDGQHGEVVYDAASVGNVLVHQDELAWVETRSVGGQVRAMCLANAVIPPTSTDCPIELKSTPLCASLTWATPPAEQANNAYRLRFWVKGQSPAGPYVEPASTLTVKPWMPAHGHGTSATTVTAVGVGEYDVTNVNFTMPGEWQIQHLLKNADGTLLEQLDVVVQVP
jgi:hypothetical protein